MWPEEAIHDFPVAERCSAWPDYTAIGKTLPAPLPLALRKGCEAVKKLKMGDFNPCIPLKIQVGARHGVPLR